MPPADFLPIFFIVVPWPIAIVWRPDTGHRDVEYAGAVMLGATPKMALTPENARTTVSSVPSASAPSLRFPRSNDRAAPKPPRDRIRS